jgi:shikimate kinase
MAGAGKTTLAPLLAEGLGWRHMDTDRLIEAHHGRLLQSIYDALGREDFLALEERLVAGIGVSRMVVSTGGSVVYSPKAVARLRLLGPVVWLKIDLDTFLARVGPAADRGFARPEGMSLEDVFAERQPLYAAASDLAVDTGAASPGDCVAQMLSYLAKSPWAAKTPDNRTS